MKVLIGVTIALLLTVVPGYVQEHGREHGSRGFGGGYIVSV
jgi:hypothetical protein